uniref:Uncharacterized protein n=1 Tax=Anguilla anguilla TaxID=7936 RepID=A0A0E9UCR2_ANGAN
MNYSCSVRKHWKNPLLSGALERYKIPHTALYRFHRK